jgi:hypothetical protein
LLIVCLFSHSCQKDTVYKTINLKFDKIVEIETNGLINSPCNYIQPLNSNYVLFLNCENKNLTKLDLSQMKLNKVCRLETDTIMNWFYDSAKNQIYTVHYDQIYKFSLSGTFLDSISVPSFKNGFFELSSNLFSPIIENDNIYFNFFPNIDGNYRNKFFYSQPIEGMFDYKKKEGATLNQDYPYNYKSNCYGYNYCPERIAISMNKHAYTFSYNDSIYILNLRTNEKKQYFFGSYKTKSFNYIKFQDIKKLNNTIFDELFNNNPFYLNTRYAPLAKRFYRSFYNKKKRESKDNIRDYSLILYDNNLNYIGETEPVKNIGTIIDSKQGLLSLTYKNNKLIINKITW